MRRRQLLKAGLVVAGKLVLSPLGGAQSWARARARERLRIGGSLNLTGFFRGEGLGQKLGYLLWQEEVNVRGGMLGRPVELVLYDDGYQAPRAAENYRRLIRDDRVDLLLGPFGSVPSLGAAPIVEAAGIPCVFPMASNPQIWAPGRRWCVQLIPPSPRFMEAVTELLAREGLETLALLYVETGIHRDIAAGFRRSAAAHGLRVVLYESYPNDDRAPARVAGLCRQARTLRPDVVANIRQGAGSGEMIAIARRVGLEPRLFVWTEIDEEEWLEVGSERRGMVGSGFWLPHIGYRGNASFVRRFRGRWPQGIPGRPLSHLLDHHPPAGYAACQLTQWAVEAANSFDRAAIRDALFGMRTETVFGRYGVDSKGSQMRKVSAALQWQAGRREVVWPPWLKTADLKLPERRGAGG